MNQLAIIEPGELELESLNAVEIFVPKGIMPIVDRIRKDVKSEVLDVTTPDGRKRIASLAYKVSKAKTFLDKMGKDLTEEWKAKSKIVDTERKIAWDSLDALKDEIRKPLTDWENAEEARVNRLKGIIEETIRAGAQAKEMWAILDIKGMQNHKAQIESQILPGVYQWDEFEDWANSAHAEAVVAFDDAIAKKTKMISDEAELEALRKEKEERDRQDRERQIAEEAAAKARADAEAAAALAAEKAKEEAEAAVRAEQELSAAAARKAADEASAAQRRIEQAQRDAQLANERAEKSKADAERQAGIAVERERQRQLDEERESAEAKAAREANKAHRAKIEKAAENALKDIIEGQHGKDGPEVLAREIVEAIAEGRIPNVKINY